jgi:hypothetical protein
MIHPSCKGTKVPLDTRFLLNQAELSVVRCAAHGLTTWTCEAVRYWGFECWSSHASLPIYFRLSIQAVRCCSHLAQPCDVFRSWCGKTYDTLIDRSHDAWPESGDTSGVVTSTEIRKYNLSRDIRFESYLSTEVRHTTRVASSDWSQLYDQSHVFWPESDIRPKSRIQPESWYTCIICMYNG